MKITMIAGSPHGLSGFGGTMAAIIAERLEQKGADLTTFSLADLTIKSCTGCYVCCKKGACVFDDDYEKVYASQVDSDGIIWLVPNYTYNVTAEMKTFLDRGFSNMHLQVLKGKYGLPVITSGSWVLEDPLEYLVKTFQRNGCWVVDQVGISMAEWAQIEDEKRMQLLSGIDSLVDAIEKKTVFRDQEKKLQEIFEMWRMYMSHFKEENPHELASWLKRWPDATLD